MQWHKQIIIFEERFYTSKKKKKSVLFLCTWSVFSLHKCRGWREGAVWWYAQRKHNSKPRKSCKLWLRVNSIAGGWFKFMLGKSFIFSFLQRIWDKSLNTWKTRKFKQCVFLSFHSGNFSFVIHFSPTAVWSLGAHMGCGKGKTQGDASFDSEKQHLWSGPHTQKECRSHLIANSNFLEKDDLKYVNPCWGCLDGSDYLVFQCKDGSWAERQIFFKKLWYKKQVPAWQSTLSFTNGVAAWGPFRKYRTLRAMRARAKIHLHVPQWLKMKSKKPSAFILLIKGQC